MSQEIQGQIRHTLTFLAGLAVARGWIDGETAVAIVGVAIAIVGLVWSWKSKPDVVAKPSRIKRGEQ